MKSLLPFAIPLLLAAQAAPATDFGQAHLIACGGNFCLFERESARNVATAPDGVRTVTLTVQEGSAAAPGATPDWKWIYTRFARCDDQHPSITSGGADGAVNLKKPKRSELPATAAYLRTCHGFYGRPQDWQGRRER